MKQTTYSKYELGKVNIPIEVFIKLADYYKVSIDYIVGRTSKKIKAERCHP
ncbi:MAG: helix-turn-helix transcriptional regulator [Lachnospiraceae bacterium]|nr:helix-turn-helix transcriptional regulator [Lachnospiraceae bacterium]